MANTCKYVQTPAVLKAKGTRVTIGQRVRRWMYEKRNPMPRLVTVDFYQPVYPRKG